MKATEIIQGTTRRVYWINSGQSPSSIGVGFYDKDETLVHSVAAVDSGNGHYYADVTFYTGSFAVGYYAYAFDANMNSKPYINKALLKIKALEVD